MKISVCLATYNGGRYLAEQLESILPQLNDSDELLIADDGSTDDTLAIAKRYGERIRIIATERVGGVVPNFERAIGAATGDGIVLCDQDDVWLPGRIDTIRHSLAHATLVILNGDVVDEKLAPRGQDIFRLVDMRAGFASNLVKNSFIGCCMAFQRQLRDRVLPFPRAVPWHDWYIGLVAELTGTVERKDMVTILYRRHGANFSPTGDKSKNSFAKMLWIRIAVLRAVLIAAFVRRASGGKDGSK